MNKLFTFPNLGASGGVEKYPWEEISKALERSPQFLNLGKAERLAKLNTQQVDWPVYSCVRSMNPGLVASKDNAPMAIRAVALDYDTSMFRAEQIASLLFRNMDSTFLPQFVEMTLGGNFRLLYVFEKEILAPDATFVKAFFQRFFKRINAQTLFTSFDKKSGDPYERWTAGKKWLPVSKSAFPHSIALALATETAGEYKAADTVEVPLHVIKQEIDARWPGKFHGEFREGAQTVRFWDPEADCPTGAIVKPDGFLCFTGFKPFVSWGDLLGFDWVARQKEDKVTHAIGGIYFDGRAYWKDGGDTGWAQISREDIMLQFKANGFSAKTPKGATISPAETLLNTVQIQNRVNAAVPLINYRPGIVTLKSQRFLNTSSLQALIPEEGLPGNPEEEFPFTWTFLNGLFARPENKPLEHFLAWLKRSYIAFKDYRKDSGQVVFLCGPKANGKTLLTMRIVNPLLGDRDGDPYEFLIGGGFNSDLFECGLWAINDAHAPRNQGESGSVLAKIKNVAVNTSHTYHKKFGLQTSVERIGRLMVTLNDDPQAVSMLPEVTPSTEDKMSFFASKQYGGTFGSNHDVEKTLRQELPFFARWLLNWQPPAVVLTNDRMGVESFYDPEILKHSRQQTYWHNFLELINVWKTSLNGQNEVFEPWTGTATELLGYLTTNPVTDKVAQNWKVGSAAKALTALAADSTSGISLDNSGTERIFTIVP